MQRYLLTLPVILMLPVLVFSQNTINLEEVQPGRFDQGKMWTFENPPVEYFEEEYGFTPSQEWMDDVRKSALRFASWCSASFISENGLIMTNHHCSRSVVASVMKEGESFDENGFYAKTQEEERRVPDLFVDQLLLIADITQEVKKRKDMEPDSALNVIQKEYAAKEAWKDLILETRTFYSGGKYSLYGFKRYEDIRLVLYPELPLGYYGGDPDNFTYPRYNLDFTFFRAYDEDGIPLIPSNYFEFNPKGANENDPVFVIGNPGSTGRYLTMSQLYYQRDVSVPTVLSFLRNRVDILMLTADRIEDVYKKDSVTNLAFSLSNANKAYTGRLDGLNDPYLMAKKAKKEEEVRENFDNESADPWNKIEDNVKEMSKHYAETLLLAPSAVRGKVNIILHKLQDYEKALLAEKTEEVEKIKTDLLKTLNNFEPGLERALFAALLEELNEHSRQGYMAGLLEGEGPYETTKKLLENSILINDPDKFFDLKAKRLDKEPLMQYSNTLVSAYQVSTKRLGELRQENEELEEKIMNMQFQISGVSSPPDATFSLRLADGVVKGYEYNGTVAPWKTTYFGLYDRHYSHGQEYPWNLPEKWKNPPMELLKEPLNFVCTADIIGGNSGSPVINTKAEVVGLVFDGNIESLPGYFIFDDQLNRTVSVHSGGIVAAIKYIYKADRLLSELNAE